MHSYNVNSRFAVITEVAALTVDILIGTFKQCHQTFYTWEVGIEVGSR